MAKDVVAGETKTEDKKVVKKKERIVIPTKLVIRRLPPALTEDELLQVIDPLPLHDYFRFVTGDTTLAPENYCRAYINLASPDDILAFRDKVDGLEFTDSKGNCQPCVLEYAPFPKNPKRSKKKEDSKAGTIEEDADYKAFLESLQKEEEKTVFDLELYLEELENREQKNKCVDTPLTTFLKQKREEKKRIRDERRRADQERRKKREEERRKRDLERKKKLELEKNRKKKEEKRISLKKDEASNKEEVDDPKLEKSEPHGKGDAKLMDKARRQAVPPERLRGGIFSHAELEKRWMAEKSVQNKKQSIDNNQLIRELLSKFEMDRPKTGPRFSDAKSKKPEAVRRGPIGAKPKHGEEEEGERGYRERPHSGKEGHERGGYGGRGARARGGYRPSSSRDIPPRKWDKGDERGKPKEDQDKKLDRNKSKRPDREIYRPGSGRGGARGGSHKYSEQRTPNKRDLEK